MFLNETRHYYGSIRPAYEAPSHRLALNIRRVINVIRMYAYSGRDERNGNPLPNDCSQIRVFRNRRFAMLGQKRKPYIAHRRLLENLAG